MKISRSTKQLIANLKAEASASITNLVIVKARIGEHPGTKTATRELAKAIELLEKWKRQTI